MEKQKQDIYSFLVLADIHSNMKNLQLLKKWYYENNPNYDFIFLLGDIVVIKDENRGKNENESAVELELNNIVKFLHSFNNKPIIFIPGNHDPTSSFINNSSLTLQNFFNIHKSYFQIEENLILVGLGGSIPAFKNNEFDKPCEIWKGYPYTLKDDPKFNEDLEKTFNMAYQKFGENSDYILVTHNGPSNSPTTVVKDLTTPNDPNLIYGGSEAISDLLKKFKSIILLNLHGHNHLSKGKIKFLNDGKIEILNPGALTDDMFAEIKISRDSTGRFSILSEKFNFLI